MCKGVFQFVNLYFGVLCLFCFALLSCVVIWCVVFCCGVLLLIVLGCFGLCYDVLG